MRDETFQHPQSQPHPSTNDPPTSKGNAKPFSSSSKQNERNDNAASDDSGHGTGDDSDNNNYSTGYRPKETDLQCDRVGAKTRAPQVSDADASIYNDTEDINPSVTTVNEKNSRGTQTDDDNMYQCEVAGLDNICCSNGRSTPNSVGYSSGSGSASSIGSTAFTG